MGSEIENDGSPKTSNFKECKSTGFKSWRAHAVVLGLDFFEMLVKFIAGPPLGTRRKHPLILRFSGDFWFHFIST